MGWAPWLHTWGITSHVRECNKPTRQMKDPENVRILHTLQQELQFSKLETSAGPGERN